MAHPMRLPGFILALGLTGLLALATPIRRALAADDASSFIAQTADSVLKLARNSSLSQEQYKQQLRTIADQAFEVPFLAQWVVGPIYWPRATPVERQEFLVLFKNYMMQVYATRFRQYSGSTFKVVGQRQEGMSTMVTTEIAQPNNQQPVRVIWRVVKTANGYKIIDVIIEGISQFTPYRQEFGSVIEQNDGQFSALIRYLEQKASE